MLFKNREQIIENGQTPELKSIREDVLDVLNSALDAVNPYNAVKSKFDGKNINFKSETIDISDFENIYLVGFGKASIGMAQAVCDSVNVKQGAVVTNDPGNKVQSDCISTFVGSHPIPDEKSIEGTEKILEIVEKCEENDLLIVLISGGGSALLEKPRVRINDLQKTTDLLLKSGANINEINTIRKHLSFVKGGQLAASAKCMIISFIVSDIIGDPMEFIASGPTYPDSTTYQDAQRILNKYNLWTKLPSSVQDVIEDGIKGKIPETPKKNDPAFNDVFNFIVANNKIACNAAKEKAEELEYKAILLTTSLDGEAKDIGKYLAEKAANYLTEGKKVVFISGGETTVTIKGSGKGGRNQEMILGSLEELADKNIVFSSFATDGIDGMSDAAGAIADTFTMKRALKNNLDPKEFLENNNSYEFFKILDDLFLTGPTGTNVMDIQILVKNR
ncbi:MAG: glycerate kinase [Thermoplasmatales archaeon]|nr:glycerate kinase [Thermoplasmatales archaeon]